MTSSPQKGERVSSRTINQNLLGFIPALVVDNLLEKIKKKEIRKLPEKQTLNSVVMFADISGFTNLSEKLSQKGSEGAELLAFALTRYMEGLVKAIGRSGGDIFKFAGDAMIVLWPPPQHNTEEELTTLCRQAIQSALDIQSKLHEIKMVEDIKLSVKIGFGVGQVTILHVGGVFSRAEYLAAGDPLTEAFECEHLATAGGVVIVSKKVFERVQSYFEFTPVPVDPEHHHKSDNAPFFFVQKVKKDQKVKMKADALLIKNKLKPSDVESIRQSLISYIPAAVMTFLLVDQEKWSHELRRLSVMFCNLGIDLSDAQTAKGLERIQLVIETVQRCVYFYQGSLNKLLMDDKGSTLMIIFGLHPMAHQDDPVRAVLTGLSLIKELKKINCSCSLGITTGVVFAGVVGTSGSRREFSVLGDTVNLSARFMQAACKEKEKKILVDDSTKREAENKISFRFFMYQKVKGKSGDIPFYEPVDFDDEEISRFPFNVRTHMNSPQKGVVNHSDSFDIFGRQVEEELSKSRTLIENFIKKNNHNMLILIQGTYGIGKSLFIRVLLERASKILDTQSWKYNEQTHMLVSYLNCSNRTGFLNGWRSILQKVLNLYSFRIKTTPETAIIKILEGSSLLDNYHLMADILGLKLNRRGVVDHEKFDEKEQKAVFSISIKILSAFLEETGENKEKNNKDLPNTNQIAPLFVVLDDMQDYDVFSWTLIKKVMKKIRRIFIIGAVRTEYCELPPVFAKRNDSPRPKPNNDDNKQDLTLEEIMENGILELEEAIDSASFYKIELDDFSKDDISTMLRKKLNYVEVCYEGEDLLPKEQSQSMNPPSSEPQQHGKKLMTQKTKKDPPLIEDSYPSKSIKRAKTINKIKKKSQKDKSASEYHLPSYRLLRLIKCKTNGLPLDILHLGAKLLEGGYIELKNDKLMVKNKLRKCIEINQFLTVEAPICRVVVNGEILDRLDCESYLLMKAAAVIGECFDIVTLLKVNPFKATIPADKVKRLILALEKQDFLEILDEQEHNTIYRFMHPFMREVIYQRMIFSQRRQIHRFVAEALQSIPLENEANEKVECDNLIYHWSLAENQDVFQATLNNSSFSNKAKRSVIVKKISSIVSKNPNNLNITLKSGWLEKKSDRGMSWSNRFVVMSCKDLKYYYSENDYKENTDVALGVISLKHIFNIFQLNDRETKKEFAFMIYTGSWQKKNKEMGIREFYFAGNGFEEMETWITYIEFIRAKAIYDDFVYSFGKISFPLSNNVDKLEGIDNTGKEASTMSRMTLITQAMESSKIFHKTTSFLLRKNTSRKMTAMKGLKSINSLQLNSIQEVTNSNINQELAKKLKERIQRFFMLSLMLFSSHVIEVASKLPRSKYQNVLGGTTTVFRKYPFIVEPSLFDDSKPVLAQKMNTFNSMESIEVTAYGGSPKQIRTSLLRLGSAGDELFQNDSIGGGNVNKKLEEPPTLNPRNLNFMANYGNKNNPLEMIQEEMEDRNSIHDLRKFKASTDNRVQQKLETIRESVQMIERDEVQLDSSKDFEKNVFDLESVKPSTLLTPNDVEMINKMNESSKKTQKEKDLEEEENKEEEDSTPMSDLNAELNFLRENKSKALKTAAYKIFDSKETSPIDEKNQDKTQTSFDNLKRSSHRDKTPNHSLGIPAQTPPKEPRKSENDWPKPFLNPPLKFNDPETKPSFSNKDPTLKTVRTPKKTQSVQNFFEEKEKFSDKYSDKFSDKYSERLSEKLVENEKVSEKYPNAKSSEKLLSIPQDKPKNSVRLSNKLGEKQTFEKVQENSRSLSKPGEFQLKPEPLGMGTHKVLLRKQKKETAEIDEKKEEERIKNSREGSQIREKLTTNKVNYIKAFTKRKTHSIDGDSFEIQKGELVLLTRVYEKTEIGEIFYQGMIGLFLLNDLEIPESAKKEARSRSPGENVRADDSDDGARQSSQIPKVLQRKQMMEERNKKSRSPTPIKEEKSRLFNERTIVRKSNHQSDDDRNNWNYGKITFQIKGK